MSLGFAFFPNWVLCFNLCLYMFDFVYDLLNLIVDGLSITATGILKKRLFIKMIKTNIALVSVWIELTESTFAF